MTWDITKVAENSRNRDSRDRRDKPKLPLPSRLCTGGLPPIFVRSLCCFFRLARIAASPQLRVERKVWPVSHCTFSWLRSETRTKFLSPVVLEIFSWEHMGNFLNFIRRRFSQAWNEVIELKIRMRTQLTPENKRWIFLRLDAEEKNANAREKDVFFSGKICSKSLSRSNSGSKGTTRKLLLTSLHDLKPKNPEKIFQTDRGTFFKGISGERRWRAGYAAACRCGFDSQSQLFQTSVIAAFKTKLDDHD